MKALTLHQPYASLIAYGIKTIETRSWKPPDDLIGERFAIHAGKTMDMDEELWEQIAAIEDEAIREMLQPDRLPQGEVVAIATLNNACRVIRDAYDDEELVTVELMRAAYATDMETGERKIVTKGELKIDPWGNFDLGRWLWKLGDIERIEYPVPATGRLGLWEFAIGDNLVGTRSCLIPRG